MSLEEKIWKTAVMRFMHLLSRLIILVLLLTSTACSNSEKITYLNPLDESPVFPYLKEDLRHEFLVANNGEDVANYVLEMLGKPTPKMVLKDYLGNDYSFPQEGIFVLELVASWCEHCQRQATIYNQELLAAGVELVEYFNVDGPEGIKSFLDITKQNVEELTIIPHDDEMTAFIDKNYYPQYYPTFIIFNNGKVAFACSSQLQLKQFLNIRKLCDLNLSTDDLTDSDGNSIFSHYHPFNVLEKEIGAERLDRLKQLDNDGNTYYLTLSQIGKVIDLDVPKGELIIFVISDDSKLADIENYKKRHPDSKCLILCRNKLSDEISLPYSSIAEAPIETAASFSAIYVIDSRIAGVYSNPLDLQAAECLFFGEDALIYLR